MIQLNLWVRNKFILMWGPGWLNELGRWI